MLSLASALPAAVAKDGVGIPQTKPGHFPTTFSVITTSSRSISATFSPDVSSVATASFSEKENNFTAIDPHIGENFPELQNATTKLIDVQVSTTPKATVSLLLSPAAVHAPEVKPPPSINASHEAHAMQDICTIEDSITMPDLPDVKCKVSSDLSPNASTWLPATPSKNIDILYPPGRNMKGVEYRVTDDAWIAVEFGEKSTNSFELPGDAQPDLEKVSKLFNNEVILPNGSSFIDKILPQSASHLHEDNNFPAIHYINLHHKVRESGTYNFAGARVDLPHCKLNVANFRKYLLSYDDQEICQFLQFGFPLGLAQEIFLEPALKNHQSSYCFYSYIDSFLEKEISSRGVAGPLPLPPFTPTMLSPMMTSPKNPSSRRPVFDATWGDWSLNENTPVKSYLGENYNFTFPTVLDLADLILEEGPGCLLWKRDLARWFMQLPVDPADYDKLGFLWRGNFWWFVSFIWGCRNAGYAGQRVASAILYILRNMGLSLGSKPYNAVVYMDDFAGCEVGRRATAAFEALGKLLEELGVQESTSKACPPSTKMKFLGVEFDTVAMSMSVDADKLKEITTLSKVWARKTVATKQDLQSILGKLMWVSKVVRFSRCFVSRIISILKGLRSQKQKVTLDHETRKDFLWWSEFLPVFNGVEIIVPDTVFCSVVGDATLQGGGSWNEREREYFSRRFPAHLIDPRIYIHIKEFLVSITSAKLWGHLWEGRRVAIYCDNEAVVKTMVYQKPQDHELQKCLREMLYLACKFHFQPIFLRITTDENDIADFISRRHDPEAIRSKFKSRGLANMKEIVVPDEMFEYVADW